MSYWQWSCWDLRKTWPGCAGFDSGNLLFKTILTCLWQTDVRGTGAVAGRSLRGYCSKSGKRNFSPREGNLDSFEVSTINTKQSVCISIFYLFGRGISIRQFILQMQAMAKIGLSCSWALRSRRLQLIPDLPCGWQKLNYLSHHYCLSGSNVGHRCPNQMS